MRTFAIDRNNDFVVNGNDLAGIDSGLQACLVLAKNYAQTLRGEMIHAMGDGIRFFETGFNSPRLALFEHDFRQRVLQVDGVRAITFFEASIVGENLVYNATIETIYGVGKIDNG